MSNMSNTAYMSECSHSVESVGGTMVSINIITPVSAPAPSIVGNLNQAGDINHVLSPVSQQSGSMGT